MKRAVKRLLLKSVLGLAGLLLIVLLWNVASVGLGPFFTEVSVESAMDNMAGVSKTPDTQVLVGVASGVFFVLSLVALGFVIILTGFLFFNLVVGVVWRLRARGKIRSNDG
jgi:hypothetical protein